MLFVCRYVSMVSRLASLLIIGILALWGAHTLANFPTWDNEKTCNPLFFIKGLLTTSEEMQKLRIEFNRFRNELKKISEGNIVKVFGYKKFPSNHLSNYTLQRKKTQKPLSNTYFRQMNIPEDMIDFYDRQTGRFNYKRNFPIILSSENGRESLKMIRISINEPWQLLTLEHYVNVLQRDKNLQILVTSSNGIKTQLENLIKCFPTDISKRIKMYELDSGNSIQVWTQDSSKPIVSHKYSTLIPANPVRTTYIEPLKYLESKDFLELIQSPFHFQGGNVIVGERHLFIGTDDFTANMDKLRLSRQELKDALEIEFGTPVLEVGSFVKGEHTPTQPDFHIDLSLSVVFDKKNKQEVILLDSAKVLLDSLEKILLDQNINQQEYRYLKYFSDHKINPVHLLKREASLNQIQQDLESFGYRVIRIPGYNNRGRTMINYSNSIYSNDYAIIPETGLRILDKDFQDLMRTLGYEPISMPVVQHSFNYHGGIRCMTETYRENYVSIPHGGCTR